MRVLFLFTALIAVCCVVGIGIAADAPTPAAETWDKPTPIVEPGPAGPFAELGKFSRQDRRLARDVMRDAAEAMGQSRRELMRGVMSERVNGYRGPTPHLDELETSLALHDDAPGFDIEEFGRILEMIIEFIQKLMAIFGMFSCNAPADAPMVASVPFPIHYPLSTTHYPLPTIHCAA